MENLFPDIERCRATAEHLLAELRDGVLTPGESEYHEESTQNGGSDTHYSNRNELRIKVHAGDGHCQGFAVARQAAKHHDAGNEGGHWEGY